MAGLIAEMLFMLLYIYNTVGWVENTKNTGYPFDNWAHAKIL